ncbi:hypothetical protein LOTGIDRAFT_169741 [Lottia gigantea]|uniref:Bardet-Biedl syndrome 10 protein n=1 Tax=Lottia gigantea TaxID=225164 RepID=V3ZL20_LOTGI|nr:hypothetical protein LOTGIDRAFT_169741 [Lottia gigantea]ESO83100.1 hypothetical protein LOTGIDRAFT_169741 [Lottia gigantea]
MAETTKVTLKHLLDISKTLKNIVCRSFGPRCQTTLLATPTGQIMVTTDGIKILKSLNIGHPIGRLIVNAVSAHHNVNADGVKTFLLYLCEFLHQLDKLGDNSPKNLISVSKSISKFMDEILPKCLENFKSNGLFELNSELFFPLELDHYLTDFIKTTLTPNLRKNQVNLFSKLFSSVIMNGSNSLTKILERADLFCDFFEYLHVKGTGPYSDSKVISGFLLRPFSCNFHDASKSSLNFVILRNSIEGNKTPEPEEVVRITSEDSLNATIMSPIKVAEEFLKKLNSSSVDLILMSEKVPQFVLTLCRKYHISVIVCLDDQEINLVEMLSSTPSLLSVFEEISERNIGQTFACERIKFGKCVYTNIHFNNCLYVKSFVLCGPTEGLAHELSSLIYKSFRSIQASATKKEASSILSNHVTKQTSISDTKVAISEDLISKHFESSSTLNDRNSLTKANISDAKLDEMEARNLDSAMFLRNKYSSKEADISCSQITGSVQMKTENAVPLPTEVDISSASIVDNWPQHFDSSATINDGRNVIEKSENIRQESTYNTLLLPAGSYFEFQLAKYIRQSTENFKESEFGDLGKLIFETLLAVPRSLHSNLCERNSNDKRHFLEILQEVLNSDSNMCLNSRGHVYCPSENFDTLESFNLKMATLCNVLQLIQQLLRLDLIIGVKSLKPE